MGEGCTGQIEQCAIGRADDIIHNVKTNKEDARMVTKGMFSSNTDMWETPQWLFDQLNEEFHFTVDVCAVAENAKCRTYFSPEVDGLSKDWKRGGAALIGAILHTDGRSGSGSKRRQSAARRLSCSSRHEPILHGSTTTYLAGRRSVFCADGSNSEIAKTALHSRP